MLLCSLRFILFNSLWQNYLTLCSLGLGLGLEVQSLGLGLDQKGLVLVLVLVSENFRSLGLGLEEKVLFTSLQVTLFHLIVNTAGLISKATKPCAFVLSK